MENSENYEYIECTPSLWSIGVEPDEESIEEVITSDQKLQCPSCEYKTRRRDLLLSHTMLHEKELSLSITGQQQIECTFTLLKRGDQFFYKCIRCFYLTAAWQEIKRHVRRKHTGETAYNCDWCTEFASPNLALLKWHVEKKHWRNLPYRCERCKFTAWRLRELQLHQIKHYSPADITCSLCGKESSSRKSLLSHLRSHTATYCSDCNRWVNNASIDRHKLRHANKKIKGKKKNDKMKSKM